ncbi:MAG: hypothetical protein WKF35_09740 [Ferruginibacter sp.]
MKTFFSCILFLSFSFLSSAQVDITNRGIVKLTGSTDTFFMNGNFTNTSSAELMNDGNVFIKGDLVNEQVPYLGGTGIIFMNGTIDQNLSSTSAFTNLTINKTVGKVILSTNALIRNTLNFIAGNIQTGSDTVSVLSTGIITGAAQNTGWVEGIVQKNLITGSVSKSFEIGDAIVYAPVSIDFPNVLTSGNIAAKTTTGDHPNLNISIIRPTKSVNRYWTITNSDAVFNSYQATFNFASSDVDAGSNTSLFGVGLYDGTNWTMLGTSFRNSTNIRAAGYNTLGSYAIGETFVVVPLTFKNIKAYPKVNDVIVEWEIENEEGIKSYEVERSGKGIDFKRIHTRSATGDMFYDLIDAYPLPGDNFYRIRYITLNGEFKYSKIVYVNFNNDPGITVFPNPVSSSVMTVRLNNIPQGNYKLNLYNSSGQLIMVYAVQHKGINLNYIIPIDRYPAGRYEAVLSGSIKTISIPVIIE